SCSACCVVIPSEVTVLISRIELAQTYRASFWLVRLCANIGRIHGEGLSELIAAKRIAPDHWTSFATGQLGLQAVDRGGAMRAFRMDDRKQRLIADGSLPDGERFFGWEVAGAAAPPPVPLYFIHVNPRHHSLGDRLRGLEAYQTIKPLQDECAAALARAGAGQV